MRLPVIPNLSTKDGLANKNARLTNVLAEKNKAQIRPGLTQVLDYAGDGSGLISWNRDLIILFGDTIYTGSSYGFASPSAAFNLASGSYAAGTTYAMGDQVWSGGILWTSLVGSNTGNTPAVGPWWVKSFPPAWSVTYTYPIGSWVHYNGYYWRSLVSPNTGNTPAEGASWTSPNPPAKASGGAITYDGLYSIHTFTTSGTFTVNIAPLSVDYLIIGGGGGSWQGGGGAGGLSYITGHSIAGTGPITVTVGAGSAFGGAGATNGGNTTFITTVTGGGRGGGQGENGAAGGCGGGGGWGAVGGGTTTGGTASVGFAGGGGVNDVNDLVPAGGGGGGMGAVGTAAVELTSSGNGGDGVQNSISGVAVWYSGGGAGDVSGGSYGTAGQGQSGPGGGGSEKVGVDLDARDGIVIIRYLT